LHVRCGALPARRRGHQPLLLSLYELPPRRRCARGALGHVRAPYRHERRAADIDVTLASLDDACALAPTMHLWVSDKLPWVSISDGLPQFERGLTP
jgi:hypothetical protein